MSIYLEIYLISGAIVGFFEGLFLESNTKKLFKEKKAISLEAAKSSVMFGTVMIAILPIINTLHVIMKTIALFAKSKKK